MDNWQKELHSFSGRESGALLNIILVISYRAGTKVNFTHGILRTSLFCIKTVDGKACLVLPKTLDTAALKKCG